jgi:hypothetical protein
MRLPLAGAEGKVELARETLSASKCGALRHNEARYRRFIKHRLQANNMTLFCEEFADFFLCT